MTAFKGEACYQIGKFKSLKSNESWTITTNCRKVLRVALENKKGGKVKHSTSHLEAEWIKLLLLFSLVSHHLENAFLHKSIIKTHITIHKTQKQRREYSVLPSYKISITNKFGLQDLNSFSLFSTILCFNLKVLQYRISS